MKVAALIQARMGSTRLPGKVFINLKGRPILWHVVNRLSKSRLIDKIIVCTTDRENDQVISDFCKENSIACFRGSEDDVLDRYYQAAKVHKVDVIVRITSDCPLIDPLVTDKVINRYLQDLDRCDGASNVIKRTYPRGLDTEVFSFQALENAWRQAKEHYQREHVTIFMYENPDKFKFSSVECKEDSSYLRWTLDEEADLQFIKEIYARLYKGPRLFTSRQILDLLKRELGLSQINQDVMQKNRADK